MSVDTKITKPLGQGRVQVDVKYKGGYTRYYSVSKKNAHGFANEFKTNEKNMDMCSNIVYFTTIFGGILATIPFTKNVNSWMKKMLIQFASAIGFSTLAMVGMNEFANSKEKEVVNKYRAKEIFYRA